ncbi:diguanylate phosphodiesterase [Bradyrhizobium sp. SSBR45G]|uniref:EAL domain-containing protein n=1 Tax=unclassified Bradyrhizobium TaxID=2631580 RepID=UPI002342A629|nr:MULTISPECIES: EAL domain-containing protein [unclassified Bradyrhizobium]GLH82109.1 diguanylate phosphodiesterase [Bradyrhizobium sp. SSBR45G]GLH89541.1 diguanylate phosphodiesterase [Bradyrhizobium sp. SSBR45R]
MIRISTIFIAICMVLVAASLGLILYSVAGISGSESAIVSLAALTFLILYNAVSMRLRDRSDVGSQIADLSRGTADLARQVAEFGRRLSAVEGRMVSSNSVSADRLQGVIGEINELGGLMKQLAVTVSQHEDLIAAIPPAAAAAVDSAPAPARDVSPPVAAPVASPVYPDARAASPETHDIKPREATATFSAAPAPAAVSRAPVAPPVTAAPAMPPIATSPPPAHAIPSVPRSQPQILAAVKGAIEDNRLDIYLQPLVTLPQRKVRFYEAVTRLRDERDQIVAAEDFIGIAEAAGLVGRIDHMVLLRCVQVLRRLMVRNKDVGIFCNLSSATLSSPASFAQCLDFLEANRALAPSFVLEFKQSTLRSLGPTETEHLAALAQRGYRFSIDHVTDLRFEPRELADRGVRFIKVPAALLLDPKQSSLSDIHPTDLSDLLGRFGIDLIAERIEGESSVVDLLDYDVRFGQGFLFAPPRPLRPEGASATGEPAAGPAGGQDIKIQDPNAAGPTTLDVSNTNAATRSGNAALARRIAGTI